MPPDAGDLGHVVGVWSDENRSVYVVELDPGGASCSVQTTRKSGEQRFTKALIRAEHGRVSWGQSYVLDGDRTASTGRPRWLHLKGGKSFEWWRCAVDAEPSHSWSAGAEQSSGSWSRYSGPSGRSSWPGAAAGEGGAAPRGPRAAAGRGEQRAKFLAQAWEAWGVDGASRAQGGAEIWLSEAPGGGSAPSGAGDSATAAGAAAGGAGGDDGDRWPSWSEVEAGLAGAGPWPAEDGARGGGLVPLATAAGGGGALAGAEGGGSGGRGGGWAPPAAPGCADGGGSPPQDAASDISDEVFA